MRRSVPPPEGFRAEAPPGAPAVSIVTVVRDAAATIGRTLESVAAQTCQDLEHIVVDGGSTDGTLGVVARATHPVRVVCDFDHGVYHAFNRGLALARGRWIAFLNADDVYAHPRVIETVLARAARAPRAGLIHADLDWVDASGDLVAGARFAPARAAAPGFDADMPFNHPTVFMARWVVAAIGGFDATFRIAGDYDLLLRAHLAGVPMEHVPDVFVRMQLGGLSADLRATSLELMRSWWLRTGRVPWRHALRLLKQQVLDVRAPRVSGALGAAKRRLRPHDAALRRVEVRPS